MNCMIGSTALNEEKEQLCHDSVLGLSLDDDVMPVDFKTSRTIT